MFAHDPHAADGTRALPRFSDRQPLQTFSLNLSPDVPLFATGWLTALRRNTKISVASRPVAIEAPKVLSVRIGNPTVTVRSYTFPEFPGWSTPDPAPRAAACALVPPQPPATAGLPRCTRFQPPGDIVKLQDRLYYCCSLPSNHWSVRGN